MASTKSNVEDLAEKAKARAKDVAEDVKDTATHAKDAATELTQDAHDVVSEAADSVSSEVRRTRARHRVQSAIDQAADRAHDWADRSISATFEGVDHAREAYDRYAKETTAYIRSQPVKSVFMAVGIGAALAGLLIGSLSRRDR